MNFNSELDRMRNQWQLLGIQNYFSRIHHFSSAKFKTKPSGLKGFYNWCKEREILDENLQTIGRAIKVVELIDEGLKVEDAINSAWISYPILKR